MSIIVKSKKRNRTYIRKFDYNEAKRLRKRRLSYGAIARELGVSTTAVTRALDPEVREKMDKNSEAATRARRVPCKGGCGTLVWMHQRHFVNTAGEKVERSGYCRTCLSQELAKGKVRKSKLFCTSCEEWKLDEEFGNDPRYGFRRFRRYLCKACETKARKGRRAAGRP